MTKTINSILAAFSGSSIVAIPRAYVDLLDGDYVTASLLSQLVYWSDKGKDEDGWIYKKHEDLTVEIGLSQYRIKRSGELLAELGFVEIKLKKVGTAPVTHYRVKFDNLIQALFSEEGELPLMPSPSIPIPMPPPPTGETQRTAVMSAINRRNTAFPKIHDASEIADYLLKIKSQHRPLAEAFCVAFGRSPTKSEDALWRKAWQMQYEIGIEPEDIVRTFAEMEHRNLTIKSPQSVTALAEEEMKSRIQSSKKPTMREVLVSKGAEKWQEKQERTE